MSLSANGAAEIGNVTVTTMDYRGFSPEELAEMATDRIIFVGQNSHPAILDQARAYRENIKNALVHYFTLAQQSERTNIAGKLVLSGRQDLAHLIRNL